MEMCGSLNYANVSKTQCFDQYHGMNQTSHVQRFPTVHSGVWWDWPDKIHAQVRRNDNLPAYLKTLLGK